ncbi:hypothetical protein VmeM32_00150 [Vibrio phage vB_VmeM-32]|nr:hypothetical protein VmeM32_00150 [Vibrio phage vB_VmeM-32]
MTLKLVINWPRELLILRDFVERLSNAKVYTVEVVSNFGGENQMDCLSDMWKEEAIEILSKKV